MKGARDTGEEKGSPRSVICLLLNVKESCGMAKSAIIVPSELNHARPSTTSAPATGMTNKGTWNCQKQRPSALLFCSASDDKREKGRGVRGLGLGRMPEVVVCAVVELLWGVEGFVEVERGLWSAISDCISECNPEIKQFRRASLDTLVWCKVVGLLSAISDCISERNLEIKQFRRASLDNPVDGPKRVSRARINSGHVLRRLLHWAQVYQCPDEEDVFNEDSGISVNHCEGGSCKTSDMIDFQECLEKIEVEDLNCSRIHFTWVQSRQEPSSGILKKIDRVLRNTEFMSRFINSYALFLPYLTSDHSPALLIIPKMINKKHKDFRFSNFIADKPEFINIMHDHWNINVDGCHMYKLVKKMKNLKIDWLSEGDKNSKFFHSMLKGKAHRSRIETVNDENGIRHDGAQVAEQFAKHFQNFLGKADVVEDFELGSLKCKIVSEEDVELIIRNVSDLEIKEALFDICDNKASGPDGYSAKLFKSA
nr:RNA-directed DNA polymerase, eukaryota, reverse transcriptase zinc-binding domain protein [Tanacetum cinerariifolium]